MKRQALIILLSLLFASGAGAVTETNKVITKLGTQGNNAYFYVENGFSGGCLYNVVYVPTTNTFGKFAYAQLLTAKTLNTPVSRIDYAKNGENVCVLTLIEIGG